jgi:2',3'-cyclic-nucleotide 2'-phosphodiesterase (5'-nucleotidase family)
MVMSMCVLGASGASEETTAAESADTALKIITKDYEPAADAGLDLTGLYIGEDYGDSLGDVTVAAGQTWTVEDSCVVDRLEIQDGAVVEADFPVVVFFSQSDTVENGQVMGNVQFVSDYDEKVAIIHTNDTHGFLTSEPYVRGLKTQLEQSGDYSLVLAVSGGDLFAGGYAAAHVYEGEYIPYVMAYTYDFMTWGNNDAGVSDQGIGTYFLSILGNAEGLTTLLANQNASETMDMVSYAASYEPAVGVEEFVSLYDDVLSLNGDGTIDYSALNLADYNLEAGDNALDDGALVETANGTLLGIFGESTQGGSITDAYFAGGQSTITVAQTMADELRAEGATAVVMLCHTGWLGADSTETSSNDTNTAQVALNTTGIDAIVDGHTHSVINDGEGWLFDDSASDTIVNQANCKGQAIGVMYLYLKDGQVIAKDCENIVPEDDGTYAGIEPDAEVQAAVDRCYGRLADDGYTTVYATTDIFLNGERTGAGDVGGGVRANETNLGDLVADGILYTAQKLWDGDPISIALYPGFWVRASIPAGDITLVDALSVFANPLKIYYAAYTAEELVSMMNTSCAKIGSENNSMYQVAGLSCTYDPDTFQVVTLTVGDELIYDHGTYLVDEDWTVGCAAEIGGGDIDNVPEGMEIVSSNSEMAKLWCEFLAEADYTIYPDEVSPAGRVVPAE